MFGGAVKGGQILGIYPYGLTDEGAQNIGRGWLIPSILWYAYFQGIAHYGLG